MEFRANDSLPLDLLAFCPSARLFALAAACFVPVFQDDDDGHLLALQIIRDLVDKGGDVFLDQLARLGVINKVSTLAGPASDDENEDESKPEKVKKRREVC